MVFDVYKHKSNTETHQIAINQMAELMDERKAAAIYLWPETILFASHFEHTAKPISMNKNKPTHEAHMLI